MNQTQSLWAWLGLITIYGACVGSFLNVVVYRVPRGMSLIRPASHCPGCGHGLAWYDNVPVLGWLWLRGKCRYCRKNISVQYPAVEAVTAVLFGVLFFVYYMTDQQPAFSQIGLQGTWMVLVVHLFMVGALLACTVIDARLYVIPLAITWWMAGVAAGILPWTVQWNLNNILLVPRIDERAWGMIGGAMLGLVGANILLWLGCIPRSFSENSDAPAEAQSTDTAKDQINAEDKTTAQNVEKIVHEMGTPEQWLAHPHPRREVLKELLFLIWPVLGAVCGWWWLSLDWVQGYGMRWYGWFVLFGILLGYLVGAGLVWGIRLLGTLGFGKEAMGLGDVHLLGAIGAVLGWKSAVIVFFVAPFFGLFYALVSGVLGRMLKREVKVIPYGPYLSLAAYMVMLLGDSFFLKRLGLG